MSRRPSRRKRRVGGARKLPYSRNYQLHAHEDEFVLALARERGNLSVQAWVMREPGRWNARLLGQVVKRLIRAGKIVRAGMSVTPTGPYQYNHAYRYMAVPPKVKTPSRKKARRG